jgi:hypothetical protein
LVADWRRREMVVVRVTLGVALTMALLLACSLLAAPAFAQADARGGTVQYVDCDQVQSAAGLQYGVGEVSQELNITQEQVLACLGDDDRDRDKDGETGADTEGKEDDVLADTIVKGALPETGGFPVLALVAYALVATGAFSLARLFGRRG